MRANGGTPSTDGDGRIPRRAFSVSIIAAALTNMDIAKIQVGLGSIETSLHADASALQLIVAGYALAYGLALVPSGRLGDVVSRKGMFMVGLSTFAVASVICAMAPTIEVLVGARVLQGVAAGLQMPQVVGLVQTLFTGVSRGRAFGTLGAVMSGSASVAPVLGGVLIGLGGEPDGWRLIFWINVPFALLGLILAWRFLPPTPIRVERRPELDLVGIVLLGLATAGVMVPFLIAPTAATGDNSYWLWLVPATGATAALAMWERSRSANGRHPFIDPQLLRISTFRNSIIVVGCYYAGIPGVILVMVLYALTALEVSPVIAGLMMAPFTVVAASAAIVAGRWAHRHGGRLVTLGIGIVVVGCGLLLLASLAPREWQPLTIGAAMAFAGAGGGIVSSVSQTIMLSDVDPLRGGVAASLGQVGQRVGNAIGLAAVSGAYLAATAGLAPTAPGQVVGFHHGVLTATGLIVVAFVVSFFNIRWQGSATIQPPASPE